MNDLRHNIQWNPGNGDPAAETDVYISARLPWAAVIIAGIHKMVSVFIVSDGKRIDVQGAEDRIED